jgi:hypothetical protein
MNYTLPKSRLNERAKQLSADQGELCFIKLLKFCFSEHKFPEHEYLNLTCLPLTTWSVLTADTLLVTTSESSSQT